MSLLPSACQHPTAIRLQPVLQPGHPPSPASPSSPGQPTRSSPAASGGVSRVRVDRRDFSPKACPGPAVTLLLYIPLPQILHQSHQVQSQERMKEKHKLVRTRKGSAEGGLQSCLSFLRAPSLSSLTSLSVPATCLIKRHCDRHALHTADRDRLPQWPGHPFFMASSKVPPSFLSSCSQPHDKKGEMGTLG